MKDCSPELVAYLGTTIAIDLAKGKTDEEISVIRNIALQINATLLTLISQRTNLSANEKKGTDQNKKICK